MLNFCTLFDSYYLSRGLSMYRSLEKHCPDFHLYIFPFDDKSYDMLKKLNLRHVTLVSLKEFENEDLLRVKPTRTKGEYCWTSTASTIYYCITKFNLPDCTYVDADLFFFSDPSVLNKEMGEKSILITEHRYTPEYDQSSGNGIYCVQYINFKNDTNGMRALTWWKDRCIEWCFNRAEDGKFGDQKYLDDWTTRFEGVHVLQNLGGGVAPWNVQQYNIERKGKGYQITDKNGVTDELVFYHFHWVKFLHHWKVDLGCYNLDFPLVEDIYKEWLEDIVNVEKELESKFQFRIIPAKNNFIRESKEILSNIKRRVKGMYFIVDLKKFGISG
ncbi:MAG: glycosyl transferase [Cyclobacteriaceae bacterium]|nr:glycosyl transferase [Cyclobacteriaceae bacterium]